MILVRLTCVVLLLLSAAIFFMVWAAYPTTAEAAIPWILSSTLALVAIERVTKWAHR